MNESPEGLADRLLARCAFSSAAGQVTCGVSGGPDSTAMLILARAAGLDVLAVHVDHGLRAGSQHEAATVAATAERFGAAFEARRAVVADGPNLEARARVGRHTILGDEALLGHTADDQAETVLLHLMRGTGPEGLAAMSSRRHPILGLRRRETELLCAAFGVDVVRDPSNEDRRFRRNRVRAELIPLLDEIASRDVVPLLARTAELQRDALAVLDALALDVDPCDAAAVGQLPIGLARHVLRGWWRSESQSTYAPPSAAIDRMLSVVQGESTSADIVDGWRIARRARRVRLVAPVGGTISPPR